MLDLLTFTSLYPNAVQPRHGIFVEQRIRRLVETESARVQVIAPVPWFPFRHPRFGRYAAFAAVPEHETRHGISVAHPRYPVVPKIGMNVAPLLMAGALASRVAGALSRQADSGRAAPGLIDAHFLYPDGVAAAWLGKRLRRPVVITARGNDVSLYPRYRVPWAQIRWAANQASAIITVCQALKDGLVELGVPGTKITVLRNGVDLDQFRPDESRAALRPLDLVGRVLLSVGHLIERKGNHITIEALARMPETSLVLIGDGNEGPRLRALAARLGVANRVRFLGHVDQQELPAYYSAADALVLASSREGWANVLLESMACGTPVVATDVWGTPEVVAAPPAGVLMKARSPVALVDAVDRLFASYPDRRDTRAYAERFSWDETTTGQLELFSRILTSQTTNPARR